MLIVLTTGEPAPVHSSVAAVTAVISPPKAKEADVVPFIEEDNLCLAVFKSLTSVQLVPFHSSVFPVTGGVLPPKTSPLVVVPAPAN